MCSPAPSNISQNNTEILEKQWQEMQWRYKKEQQLLEQLEEVAKSRQAERMAQKAKREAEEKAWEEAERQRVAEEKERKKRTIEYLQRLQDKVLEEEATLLEGTEGSQIMRSEHKKVTTGDEKGQQPSKKARGKYYGGAAVKIGGANPCKRYVCTRQDYLVHPSRWVINNYTYYYFFNNFPLYSYSFAYAGCNALKQRCVPHTNTNTPAMIPTYGGVLSTIKKALWELVEEYWGVGKSLWDLVEGQERNMAQLERIGAIMKQRWSSEGEVGKKESGDDTEGSEDGPRES